MPLNPEYRSAFERDEARKPADAERQKAHAERIREQTEERNRDHRRDGYLDRVVAKAPLHAVYRGGQLALWMTPQEAGTPPEQVKIPKHPFQVLDASIVGTLQTKCYIESKLFVTTNFEGDGITITNLTTALNTDIGNIDYIEITLDSSLSVTSAERKNDAGWDGFDDMFHLNDDDPDNPFYDKIYIFIAEILDNATEAAGLNRDGTVISDGTIIGRVLQFRRNHIYLEPQRDAAGVPVLFPVSAC